MAEMYIVKPTVKHDKYGEKISGNVFEVVYYCDCINHYPSTNKDEIVVVNGAFEATKEVEIAWLDSCSCSVNCDTDIQIGYYVYLSNKYWKLVGQRTYDDCGCYTVRLTLERLEPREASRKLIECISCFDVKWWEASQREPK